MLTDVSVLVVGAGPTGLLLGAELFRRGVTCHIIDAHSAPLPWDRATVLHPRSLEIFESLGIIESFLEVGIKQRIIRIHSADSVLGEIELSNCGSRYGFNIGVSEEFTELILTQYLHKQGGKVIHSSKLINLEDHQDGLIASIQHDGSIQTISARWVVGCDGYHSTVRQMSNIEMNGHDLPKPWVVFDATLPGWPHSFEGNYAYLDEIPVIITALPQQRWRVYLQPRTEDSDVVAEAASTIKRYFPRIRFDDVTNPAHFHCHSKVASHYRAGSSLLAGDAAHVCSPSQGHGMNSGLQDAFNLAWKLALVCQGHCSPVLLDSYEVERRTVGETIVNSGDLFEQALGMTTPDGRSARNETIRTVFANPTSRHQEAIAEAELDIDYHCSPIVMGDENSVLSAGQRFPNMIQTFMANRTALMLHELCHGVGHTALIIGGASVHFDTLKQLESSLKPHCSSVLINESIVLLTTSNDLNPNRRIFPDAAIQLGIGGITLLVIRPDGHVGLRADHNHLEAFKSYQLALELGCPFHTQ